MPSTANIRKLSPLIFHKGRMSPLDRFLNIDCKSGKINISDARYFFDHMLRMRPSPPLSCFSTLLGALVKCKHFPVAISFYKTLDVSGVLGSRSDLIILNILLNSYSRMRLRSAAFSAFGLVLKNGYRPSIITFSSLLKVLCLEGEMVEALGLFAKMIRLGCTPDIVTYNTVIDGLCKTGNASVALELHRSLVHGKVGPPKENSKSNMISYALIDGRMVQWPTFVTKDTNVSISPDAVSYSCLIDGLCRLGMEEDAKSLLVEMADRGVPPDVVTFNIMINSLCKQGKVDQAMEVLQTMILRGESPNTVTYSTIIDGYCRIGKMEEAVGVYKDMQCRGIFPDNVTLNILLKVLFHLKKVEDAICLFNNMKKTDGNGSCLEGRIGAARDVFSLMESYGFKCDVVTYSTLIDGYCKGGMLEEAHDLFHEMDNNGCSLDVISFNTLINGYCKSGMLEKASDLLLEMEARDCCPDVLTFTTLIDGYARRKECARIIELLQKMHNMKILPDMRTISIIVDCIDMENCQSFINSLPDFSSFGYSIKERVESLRLKSQKKNQES